MESYSVYTASTYLQRDSGLGVLGKKSVVLATFVCLQTKCSLLFWPLFLGGS